MNSLILRVILICLLASCLRADVPETGASINAELNAIVAERAEWDTARIQRLKDLGREEVAAAIKARLLPIPDPVVGENERERDILDGRLRPTKADMERFRVKNERVSLYRTLAAITEQEPDQPPWTNDDVMETLHLGATDEDEYIRGHVLATFDRFRHNMPEPFRDALLQALTSSRYPTVSGTLGTFALMHHQGMLPAQHFRGLVLDPEQAHPVLWQHALQTTEGRNDPAEETLFFTLRMNAADALIRHCDLGEVVAAWQQATDPLGKRALALAVFRKLWNPDAAFHLAPVETQVEAVRLACQDLDGMPASWIRLTGFLVTVAQAVANNTVQAEAVRAAIRTCLLHLKDLADYAEYGDFIQAIIDQL